MTSVLKKIGLGIVAINVGLLLLSVSLSCQSTLQLPMRGQLVAAGDYQLHVIDSGVTARAKSTTQHDSSSISTAISDSPMILIHGASTSALDFSSGLQPRLSKHRRVISIDRPGHGYSDRGNATLNAHPARQASMILDALQTMGIESAVLVGHSWAGAVVLAAMLEEHEYVHVRAGVLIAGVTHPWEGRVARHVKLSATPFIGTIFRWQYIEPIGRLLMPATVQSVFAPEKVPEGYIENTGLALSLRPAVYKNNALDRTRLSDFLQHQAKRYADIKQPLLSIAVSDDSVVPPLNHHARLLMQVPQMQSLEISGSGHAPHHTRPDIVVSAIESFLDALD